MCACTQIIFFWGNRWAIKREEDKQGRKKQGKERGQERTGGSRCRDFKQTKKEQMKNEERRNNNWRSSHEERTGEERKENSVDTSVFLFQYPDWSGSRLALILPAEFSKISSCSVISWAWCSLEVWLFRKNLICRSSPLVRSCRHTSKKYIHNCRGSQLRRFFPVGSSYLQ